MNVSSSTTASPMCVSIGASGITDLLMTVDILAFIFGLIFNVLTLGPIWQQVRKQNVLGIYLLNLSLSDLLFILTIPFWINYYNMDHNWKLGPNMCSVVGFVFYSNMYISIYLLCCISVDRCLVVMFPLRSKTKRTARLAWAQCITVYAVVVVCHILVLVFDKLPDAHDDTEKNDRCYETYPMQPPVVVFNIVRTCIGFLIPLLVLAVSYCKILTKVGQSPGLSAQAKRKVRLLSFGVVGIFSVCFAPYHILLLARSIVYLRSEDTNTGGSYCQFEQTMHFPFSSTLALSTLNCVVDPVLYVMVSNGVREDVKQFWRRTRTTKGEDCALRTNGSSRGKLNANII